MIKQFLTSAFTASLLLSMPSQAQRMATDSSPSEDLTRYQIYFKKRHSTVPLKEFSNGVYAIDQVSRDNWEAMEEFPPYEPFIEEGEELWNTPFANGQTYLNCFPDGPAQRKNYPYWDSRRKMVITLPLAINECRTKNGEKPLKYAKGQIASLLAYMGYESRGQITNVQLPNDPAALAAYNAGKSYYFTRRGQLNFSCAQCHMESSGLHIRADILSPSLGHTTGWPVYRSKWGALGTLHRRFEGCNKQVRAKPLKAQSEDYRNLEYFLTHMSNGIPFNGPSSRK